MKLRSVGCSLGAVLRSSHFSLYRVGISPTIQRRAASSYNSAVAGLTSDQEEFRQVVSNFAEKELAPRAAEIDRENEMPPDMFLKLGEMGLLGVTVPEDQGGLGLGYLEHTIAMEELSRASASVALSYGAHSNLMVNQLTRWGTESQRKKYLPKLLTGEHIGSLAMSEPNAGSDVVSMRTRAEKKGDSWILNGSKCWITNAPLSSTFLIYARTSVDGQPSKGLTAFLVERTWKGFEVGPHLDKFGMRGSPTAELFFDNVEIPEENVLGGVGKGAKVLMSGLDLERLVLSGGPLGIMQAALDLTLDYTHDREQFGRKIGTFQLMQGKLADMYTKLSASRAYVYAVARACDSGNISRQDCAGAILYASDRAVEVAMEAQQCLGGNGYINEYPAGRLLRDSRLYTVGAGTQEIRRMLIGRGFNEMYDEARGKGVAQ
ncbi:acyl-CoA dehydrogenase/oxidase [Naematelia encephala]|uniref:Acyl-CoA dehydrogenase/oxidase n=1 Tax=Naematelia encephala TaxID=71784 RepID=A0A1Y2AI35_9TREE|nr:acyl-CoA dehydrogenase/oxidase [Naematelia encephala]